MAKVTKEEFLSWLNKRTADLQEQKRADANHANLKGEYDKAKTLRQEANFTSGMVQMGMEVQNAAETGEAPFWPFGYGGLK
jgi:hypothetical protein